MNAFRNGGAFLKGLHCRRKDTQWVLKDVNSDIECLEATEIDGWSVLYYALY
jgi:hypothetical protein